jgi:S-methylmethionine-dependent homocysteine/selenocysteine methylase
VRKQSIGIIPSSGWQTAFTEIATYLINRGATNMISNTINIFSSPPHQGDRISTTRTGLPTRFIFLKNIEVPELVASDLLTSGPGIDRLHNYYQDYVDLALHNMLGRILDAPTWHSGNDCSNKLRCWSADTRIDTDTATTMTNAETAIGITRTADSLSIPVAISITLRTDSLLPDGLSCKHAIESIDPTTHATTAHCVINCTHPSHFVQVLKNGIDWTGRIDGLPASMPSGSHTRRDQTIKADNSDVVEFSRSYAELNRLLRNLGVVVSDPGRYIGESVVSQDRDRTAA